MTLPRFFLFLENVGHLLSKDMRPMLLYLLEELQIGEI